ncbi:MAG: PilZ domain-containing protein [Desulfuromonadaceae bacterium]|nr:PilZ domain-containing protein [Desulfuromonadaceae bacterium]
MNNNKNRVTAILLICREGKSRQVYQAELDVPGVLLVCVQTLMQFFRREVYCPLNGILVDMPTYIRSSEEEKRLLTDLVGLFPALRLRCHEPSGEIRTLPFGTGCPGNIGPAIFVQEYCTNFVQRSIRTSERSLLNIPALLNTSIPVEQVSSARSVTANISRGGCFLISFEPWGVGDRGWLVLPTLIDNTPIPVEVRSIQLWGECCSLPGMGVRFIELTKAQKDELKRLGGQNYMPEDD